MKDLRQTVFVNARFLTQRVTGVQRFAIEVSRRLKHLESPFKFRFLCPRNIIQHEIAEELGAEIVGRFRGHLWEQLDLPHATKRMPLLNLGNTGPVVKRNQVVFIYDAATRAKPHSYSFGFRSTYRILLPIVGHQARWVLTTSEFSRAEIAKYRIADPAKIEVIHGAANHMDDLIQDSSILERNGLKDTPFVLAVSSQNPSKNFEAFSTAMYSLIDKPFIGVTVGGGDPKIFNHATPSKTLLHLGYVSDEELKALYQNASLFVVPSLYEGFGLTPLEAMYSGCPTLVARAASLPEICEDGVEYFDPGNSGSLAESIERILKDLPLQDILKVRARSRSLSFSWEETCQAISLVLVEQFEQSRIKP
jgi:glycosyltransferase involved in cell wall biosynthesis